MTASAVYILLLGKYAQPTFETGYSLLTAHHSLTKRSFHVSRKRIARRVGTLPRHYYLFYVFIVGISIPTYILSPSSKSKISVIPQGEDMKIINLFIQKITPSPEFVILTVVRKRLRPLPSER